MIRAVVFDLDGVLLDSEQLWDEVRREVVAEQGGEWPAGATAALQGMSSREWSAYLHDHLRLALSPRQLVDAVVTRLLGRYRDFLPLIEGAREAVQRIGARWPLGLASSANRVVIDQVLALADLSHLFRATVSSEEVSRGKPAPDVYAEAARRLAVPTGDCVAIEDSDSGIRAAIAAGLHVVAIPNPQYRPADEVLAKADLVLERLADLTAGALEELDRRRADALAALLDEEEAESFPASDPHSDWAGPPG